MIPLATLVERAGFAPGTPVALARVAGDIIEDCVGGVWPNGQPVTMIDQFYVASLAKQVTGAALALLVRDGRIDPDRSVSDYVGGLPHWSASITPRQLAHHTSGLPPAGDLEARMAGDWTEELVLETLSALAELPTRPGTNYSYSNLGYVLLARVVAKASDMRLSEFANSGCSSRWASTTLAFSVIPPGIRNCRCSVRTARSPTATVGCGPPPAPSRCGCTSRTATRSVSPTSSPPPVSSMTAARWTMAGASACGCIAARRC
jgi:hypothetical protein